MNTPTDCTTALRLLMAAAIDARHTLAQAAANPSNPPENRAIYDANARALGEAIKVASLALGDDLAPQTSHEVLETLYFAQSTLIQVSFNMRRALENPDNNPEQRRFFEYNARIANEAITETRAAIAQMEVKHG